jgi:hypothetical protein
MSSEGRERLAADIPRLDVPARLNATATAGARYNRAAPNQLETVGSPKLRRTPQAIEEPPNLPEIGNARPNEVRPIDR